MQAALTVPCSWQVAAKSRRRQPRHGARADATAADAQGAEPPLKLVVSTTQSIASVGREAWDACALGGKEINPFVTYDFLYALEESGSVCREQGWLPLHVLVRDGSTQELLAACPLYLKGHSYGEYVFDQSWATAYERSVGSDYYPKLQSCVPFTPVTGPRLLARPGPSQRAMRDSLAAHLPAVADQLGVSSLHVTFNTKEEAEELCGRGGAFLQRTGIQYWWWNRGYTSFDNYLMSLKQSKRKTIRQERKRACEGMHIRRLTGADLRPRHWDAFYAFYLSTVDRRFGQAYLTREFFARLGETMADRVLLVVAEEEGQCGRLAAAALNLVGSHALFGRNWGCLPGYSEKFLHYELCYYSAIEHAIEAGMQRVEAGAQGEHKLQRGYLPEPTYSAHYIPDPGFRSVVDSFLGYERREMAHVMAELTRQASPYKDER